MSPHTSLPPTSKEKITLLEKARNNPTTYTQIATTILKEYGKMTQPQENQQPNPDRDKQEQQAKEQEK
jgi:hypothetical protein